MKFSFWKWLRCVVTLNHFDPGVIVVRGRECYCKRCGIRAD